ncbi:hypothetical protein LB518_01545 [Mesorhizobium sp. BR1-1-16]|uniref:hypothetical protein n=1 Tax=Mesorhizobium sp. BR1-1-16 TaxID=2876653 RepID=UPI001CCABE60|nr:hypothetical protein [Mesorhizobium sp. BR1-1-16]MBZ9934962.1 hypothetical protein [Mesorhizobium sp. BR1-1-16]
MTMRRRLIAGALAAFLAVCVVADLFVAHHPAFGIDGTAGFAAWFGIIASAVAIALALGWSRIAGRSEIVAEEEERDG